MNKKTARCRAVFLQKNWLTVKITIEHSLLTICSYRCYRFRLDILLLHPSVLFRKLLVGLQAVLDFWRHRKRIMSE